MIKEIIYANLIETLDELKLSHERDFVVEIPNIAEHGDYSTNCAMVLAKENKQAPRKLAETLIKELKKNKDYKKIEIAGPGFINFHLSPAFFQRIFWEIRRKGMDFGRKRLR